ncbi:hypothetical protein EJ03DRAFT_149640 [Teratosphaeria nubilosa]|uniref:DUF6536 domain-containing protein n=1 Tax=Teratosphaeria nubilosa TaxID=161662 RepID=A0A6G1LJ15_9PEZI|nr:hypothetical protein EJ03DRAFT_149640 [Teratosphaeria nubilosa]
MRADRDLLRRFIPETDPDEKRAKTSRVKMAKRRNMRRMRLGLAAGVICVNLAFTITVFLISPASKGVGTSFTGHCTLVSRLNTGIHVVLNILTTAFLGAGNYCMQILVAPSLSEIDQAHRDGVSLDIGVHSVHNVRYMGADRRMGWAAIGVVATMLHLVWNSAMFPSFASFILPVAVVTEDFAIAGDDWNLTQAKQAQAFVPNGPPVGSLQLSADRFTEVNASECIRMYIDPLDQTQLDLERQHYPLLGGCVRKGPALSSRR